jgi:hypothetical protein
MYVRVERNRNTQKLTTPKKNLENHSKKFDPHNSENWTGSVQFLDCDSPTNDNNTKIDSQNYWLDCHSLEIGLSQSKFFFRCRALISKDADTY